MEDRFKVRVWDEVELRYIDCIPVGGDSKNTQALFMGLDGLIYVNWMYDGPGEVSEARYIPEQTNGEKDLKGNLIFEGDILAIPGGYCGNYPKEAERQRVSWENDSSACEGSCLWINLPDDKGWNDCEIIGNIHKNPELLEG